MIGLEGYPVSIGLGKFNLVKMLEAKLRDFGFFCFLEGLKFVVD